MEYLSYLRVLQNGEENCSEALATSTFRNIFVGLVVQSEIVMLLF